MGYVRRARRWLKRWLGQEAATYSKQYAVGWSEACAFLARELRDRSDILKALDPEATPDAYVFALRFAGYAAGQARRPGQGQAPLSTGVEVHRGVIELDRGVLIDLSDGGDEIDIPEDKGLDSPTRDFRPPHKARHARSNRPALDAFPDSSYQQTAVRMEMIKTSSRFPREFWGE